MEFQALLICLGPGRQALGATAVEIGGGQAAVEVGRPAGFDVGQGGQDRRLLGLGSRGPSVSGLCVQKGVARMLDLWS